MQVYRVDDGATQDIGFDSNGLLDTAAIETFGGTSVVKISIWYDQSGNGNNGTNTNVNRYPRIYDGTDIEKDEWGNPYAVTYNVNETQPNPAFAGGEVRITSTAIASPYWAGEKGQSDSALAWSGWGLPGGEQRVQVQGVSFFFTDGGQPLTDPVILGGFIDGANSQVTVQAETDIQTVSSTPNSTILFSRGDGTRGLDRIYEFMNWTTPQTSSNDVGLRTNMNSYFKLTNLVPTGGFLSTYPGASAAYSVRRLSDEAQICMRVRRTVAPFDERNIGFDSNGDLDTTAIEEFGGSDPLAVSAWYDQSGNNNRATQVAGSSQPQIYDGSAVITENGKPAMFMNGLTPGGNFLVSAGFGTGDTRYFSYVARMTQNSGGGSFSYHSPVMFMQNAPTTGGNFLQVYTANASNSINVNYPTAALDMSSTTATNVQHLLSLQKTSTDTEFWIDGTSQDTATGTQNLEDQLSIGRFSDYGFAVMRFQELVVWNTDQDGLGNRSGIETDINTYYSIY